MSDVKHVYRLHRVQAADAELLNRVFPDCFSISEEEGQFHLEVRASDVVPESEVHTQVGCECDRFYFLTGENLAPSYVGRENPDGTGFVRSEIGAIVAGYLPLPDDVTRQDWRSPLLALQLKLWVLAQEPNLPLPLKVILLFQIVEAAYPNTGDRTVYPLYADPGAPPAPRTEAKLLRDFVSHQRGVPDNAQLQDYCRFLGVRQAFYDPTDPDMRTAVARRAGVVEQEARAIIESQITRRVP